MEHRGCTRGGAHCTGFWGVPRPPFVSDTREPYASLSSESLNDMQAVYRFRYGVKLH